jgi:hypothetical protein
MLRAFALAFACAASIALTPSSARADGLAAQVSYSVAIGKSDQDWFGHLWAGAGVHWVGGGANGAFLLAGIEAELRGAPEGEEEDRREPMAIRDFGPDEPEKSTAETWVAMRAGVGAFGRWKLAPQAAAYAIAGYRVAGPDDAARLRLGVGVSVPAAIRLACLGIPTMLEAGLDTEGSGEPSRLFLRTGWNF